MWEELLRSAPLIPFLLLHVFNHEISIVARIFHNLVQRRLQGGSNNIEAQFFVAPGLDPGRFHVTLGPDVCDASAGNTTNDRWVAAKWTTINGKFMVTIPIHGVDRVGFVRDGTLNDMVVRAATSTF